MRDLNDLFYFVQVVEHEGFAAAGRALGVPKSTLSRRVAQLERRLDTRLLQRSTRQLSVTELGQAYYRHCVAMLVEADAAEELIERNRSEPCGRVRLSCSPSVLHYLITPLLTQFMTRFPRVNVEVMATSRRVDVVQEGLDMAIRIRFPPLEDSDLVMKVLAQSPQRLLASPALIERHGLPDSFAALSQMPSLDFSYPERQHAWQLEGPDGELRQVPHQPRLITDSAETLHRAALDGLGVARLAMLVASQDLADARLIDVMPGWAPRGGVLHAVFPSRRGLLPSVRALLDFLDQQIQPEDYRSLSQQPFQS